jgi:hypothetical protein
VAWKQGRYAEKASAGKEFQPEIQSRFRRKRRAYRVPQIRNVEFGISRFLFSIPHFHRPPDPKNEMCLMVFARNALAFGPGNA